MTHRDSDLVARVGHAHSSTQPIRGPHRNGAHHAIADLLLHLQGQTLFGDGAIVILDHQRIVDFWYLVTRKLNVHHRTNTLNNFPLTHLMVPHFNIHTVPTIIDSGTPHPIPIFYNTPRANCLTRCASLRLPPHQQSLRSLL